MELHWPTTHAVVLPMSASAAPRGRPSRRMPTALVLALALVAAVGGAATVAMLRSVGVAAPHVGVGRRFLPRSSIRPPVLHSPRTISPAPCTPEGAGGTSPNDPVSNNHLDVLGGDYIIRFTAPLRCELIISGGHNVVIVGGEINVSDAVDCRPPNFSPCDPMAHAGIYLSKQSGTVYIEGVWIHGAEAGLGLDQYEPLRSSELDLVNVRIDDIHTGALATLWSDAPQAPSGIHTDCLASFEGPGRIRVDGLSCGTDYFGIQLQPDEFDCGTQTNYTVTNCVPADAGGPLGGLGRGVQLRRVNIFDNCWSPSGTRRMCGHTRYMVWLDTNGVTGATLPRTTTNDVWVDPGTRHNGRGPSSWGVCWLSGQQRCALLHAKLHFAGHPRRRRGSRDFVPAGTAGLSY